MGSTAEEVLDHTPLLLRLDNDCLLHVARSLKALGGDASVLRLVCKALCSCTDASRKRLLINPAMMQQCIALERFAAAATPQPHSSAVLRALKKWAHADVVIAFGHLPEPWIPQLVSLAVGEGEVALLQDIFLRKLGWRHAHAPLAAITAITTRMAFLVECCILSAMTAAEALPLLLAEVAAVGSCCGVGPDGAEADREQLPEASLQHIQWLLWTLCSVLTYRGEYENAQAVMAIQLQPWEPEDASYDTLRAAWGRETLVVVQLARQQYEGAVEALLAAPCWAQVEAVGRRLAQALLDEGQRRLQQRVMDFLAMGQQQQPDAQEAWQRMHQRFKYASVMVYGSVSGAELGITASGSSSSSSNAHERLAQSTFELVQLLAAGRQADAAEALLHPDFEPLSVQDAGNLVHMHLLQSMGLHHYTVPTPSQHEVLQQVERTLWAAARSDPERIGCCACAHVLLSFTAWHSLNRGSVSGALAAASPAQLPPPSNMPQAQLLPPADSVQAPPPSASMEVAAASAAARAIRAWQWDAAMAEPSPSTQPVLTLGAVGLVDHAAALLGFNLDAARCLHSFLSPSFIQVLSLQAATAAPGRRPAYVLQPDGLAVLLRLLAVPAYAHLRASLALEASSNLPPSQLPAPVCIDTLLQFERMYAQFDLLAVSLAAATADDPSPTLELDASRLEFQKRIYRDGTRSSLTCAALLGMYRHTSAAATILAQQCSCRLQNQGSNVHHNSDPASRVVSCIKQALALVNAGAEASEPAAAATGGRGPALQHKQAQPAAAAAASKAATASVVAGLLIALPEFGDLWPIKRAAECWEALGALLLMPCEAAARHEASEKQRQLMRRILHWNMRNVDTMEWSPVLHEPVLLLLHMWSEHSEVVREEAFARLVHLLHDELLPRWPLSMAMVMGGALERAPEWALAEPLCGLWRCWGDGANALRLWDAFAGAFYNFREDALRVQLLCNANAQRMVLVVQAAPDAAWGLVCGGAAAEAESGGASRGASASGSDPSSQLVSLLQCLMASWAKELHGRAAVEGGAQLVALVREARYRGAHVAEAMAVLLARQASAAGLQGLAEAVMAEVSRGA